DSAVSGVEPGDELGLALRGYVPVHKDGLSGPVVGAVMIADPLDVRFLPRLTGNVSDIRIDAGTSTTHCAPPAGLAATCRVALTAPDGSSTASLAFDVPLADVERAQTDAQRGLLIASGIVLLFGAFAAWVLARSLAEPLARLTGASQRIADGDLS